MIHLIHSLSGALQDITKTLAQESEDKALAQTGRKVETLLVSRLKKLPAEDRPKVLGAVMNSGSLKALKAIPANTSLPQPSYGGPPSPKTDFIASQPPAYQREALKRGFAMAQHERIDLIRSLAARPGNHARLSCEVLVIPGQVNSHFVAKLIGLVTELDAAGAQRVAPTVAKLLTAAAKDAAKDLAQDAEMMACLHDPAAAHPHLYRTMALFALMGVKAPPRGTYESDEIKRLMTTLFSRQGKQDLKAETGGLEAYLASGLSTPIALVREFEDKRRFFRSPMSGSRW